MPEPTFVVVDDEPAMGEMLCDVAAQVGYASVHFSVADDFIVAYDGSHDVIAVDLMMPGTDGIEVLRFLAKRECCAALILISGFDSSVLHSAQKLAQELELNFIATLDKPFHPDKLQALLKDLHRVEPPQDNGSHISHNPPGLEEIRRAVANDEFILHFQPQFQIDSGEIIGCEALVRWQHPTRGMIPPIEFIELAERNDLIDDITWIVLKKAARRLGEFHKHQPHMKLSVNLSARTLNNLDLPERIAKLCEEAGADPQTIILEITETALMQEMTKSLDILTRLRLKGFNLSIDDFGTGYSSLVQLHRAPFSEIKIDRSFVLEMENDPEARAIVETITMLGHRLKMSVIAEGVETQQMLDTLNSMGCDLAQGFHLGRPVDAKDFLSLLR